MKLGRFKDKTTGRLMASGLKRAWQTKFEKKSPKYTMAWSEVLAV
jgi:hypothetical protein